jgi:hypothetical protein
MSRSIKIQQAFKIVDARDMGLCVVCRKPGRLDHAHIFPRNTKFGSASDPRSIMLMCRKHHMDYDRNKTHLTRIRWLLRNGLESFAKFAIFEIRLYRAKRIVTRNVNIIVDRKTRQT